MGRKKPTRTGRAGSFICFRFLFFPECPGALLLALLGNVLLSLLLYPGIKYINWIKTTITRTHRIIFEMRVQRIAFHPIVKSDLGRRGHVITLADLIDLFYIALSNHQELSLQRNWAKLAESLHLSLYPAEGVEHGDIFLI